MHWRLWGVSHRGQAKFLNYNQILVRLADQNYIATRMHSSRMCNICCSGRLGVWGCLPRGCLPGGSVQGSCLPRGCLPRGCTPPPLWTEFLTHAFENITFPQLRLWTVIIDKLTYYWQTSQWYVRWYFPNKINCKKVSKMRQMIY